MSVKVILSDDRKLGSRSVVTYDPTLENDLLLRSAINVAPKAAVGGQPTYILSTSVGNFVFTGQDLTALKVDRLLIPTVASFSLTLKDLTALQAGRLISPICTSYLLTGPDVGLVYSGATTTEPEQPPEILISPKLLRKFGKKRMYPSYNLARQRENNEEIIIL
jgi:hypothetical protein